MINYISELIIATLGATVPLAAVIFAFLSYRIKSRQADILLKANYPDVFLHNVIETVANEIKYEIEVCNKSESSICLDSIRARNVKFKYDNDDTFVQDRIVNLHIPSQGEYSLVRLGAQTALSIRDKQDDPETKVMLDRKRFLITIDTIKEPITLGLLITIPKMDNKITITVDIKKLKGKLTPTIKYSKRNWFCL